MPAKETATGRFHRKLAEVCNKTGCDIDISYDGFDEAINSNRLFASWFSPYTIIARAKGEEDTVIFEINGEFEAELIGPKGDIVYVFREKMEPYKTEDICIENDNDFAALVEGKHASGFSLHLIRENKVCVSVDNKRLEPIVISDPSVARCILQSDELISGLLRNAKDAEEINPVVLAKIEQDGPEKDGEEKAALDKALEAIETDSEGIVPDQPKAEKKAEKKIAKGTKKEEKAPKKEAEKKSDAMPSGEDLTDDIPRFDLLPLGFLGTFLDFMDKESESVGVLDLIDAYKDGRCSLIEAAAGYARDNFADGTDAATALARMAETDEVFNGADAWKNGNVTKSINAAVMEYLVSRKGESERKDGILWDLFTAAWLSRTGDK